MTYVRTPKLVSALAVVLTLALAGPAGAQTLQWNTNGAGGNGSNPGTWDATSIFFDGTNNFALSPFVANNIILFGGASPTGNIAVNTYNPNPLTLSSITFTTTGYVLAAGTIGGNSTTHLTFGAGITPTINVQGAITSTINATFTTAGQALSLTTNNAGGLLVLGGGNTHTAATTIAGAGTVRLTNVNALGTTTNVNLNAGTLELAVNGTFTRPVTMANNTNLRGGAGNAAVYNAALNPVIANNATVGVGAGTGGTLTFTSGFANAAGTTTRPTINVTGPGATVLNSENDNFRANWVVQSGSLRVQNNSNDGQFGNPNANGGVAGSALTLQDATALVFIGTGNFRFNPGAVLDLPMTVTGTTTTVQPDRAAAGTGYSVTFGTLAIGTTTLNLSPTTNINAGVSELAYTGTATVTGNPTFNVTNSGAGTQTSQLSLLGAIDGGAVARTITKNGNGAMLVASASPSTLIAGSSFVVQSGRMVFQTPNSTGNATIDIRAGTTVDFQNDGDGNFSNNNVLIQVPGSTIQVGRVSGTGAVTHTVGTLAIGGASLNVQATPAASTIGANPGTNTGYGLTFGATTLTGNPTFVVSNNGTGVGTMTVGAISDGGTGRQITKNGTGALALAGTTTFADGTTIKVDGGTLAVTGATTFGATGVLDMNAGTTLRLGAANVFPGATPPTIDLDGATLRSQNTGGVGQSQTLGQYRQTSSSTIDLGTGDHTLTFASLGAYNGTLTITGWIGAPQSQGEQGKLFFTDTSGFSQTILDSIQFTGYLPGAVLVNNFLSPVPEPSSVLGVAVAGLLAGRWIRRRLRGKPAADEATPAVV